MINVWQPIMKMMCMGPQAPNPSFFRSCRPSASFPTKIAQNQQTLIEVVMLAALSSQLSRLRAIRVTIYREFSTQRAKRKPMARRAIKLENMKIARR